MPDIYTAPDTTTKEAEKPKIVSTHIPQRGSLRTLPEPTTLGLFSMFRMRPRGVTFVNQEEDEEIVLFIRRHFATNFPWLFITVLFFILPLITVFFFRLTDFVLFAISPQLLSLLVIFYYLVIFTYALMQFVVWFYHVGIVTQKRILDLDVYNILSHHLAETEMADIVDVSYAQRGFFQSFFNYGDVPIQTTAIKANFEFEDSPRPAVVSDIITDLRPPGGGKPV
jgi:hypothetical protein